MNGHKELLEWAHTHGCPWSEDTCASAAWNGNKELLEWARANGCPWDDLTCANAAGGGHKELLVWARTNGCPWDVDECMSEAVNYPDVLAWIDQQPVKSQKSQTDQSVE